MQNPKFKIGDVVYAVYLDKKSFEVVEVKIVGIKYAVDEYYYCNYSNISYRESILHTTQEEALEECMMNFAILTEK